MVTFHLANVVVHVGVGALALAAGAVALLSAKGGTLHRRAGRVFTWIAAVTLVTAVIGDMLYHPPGALVAATLGFGYQYLSSLRALASKTRGPGFIDAALALAGLGGCAALFVFMGPGTASWTPAIGYSIIGFTSTLVLYDLSRYFWARTWLLHARRLDHGIKMTGAYFAMMSAGVGNIFRDFQPLSQVGPSILGLVVMLALAVAYFMGREGAGRPAAQIG